MDAVEERLALAQAVAREAGEVGLGHFRARGALVVEAKDNPQDIVSRADREVEALIRGRIGARFPEDGVLGEELGENGGASGFTWLIDPIDGTMPFLHGLPHWSVSLGLHHEDATVAAVVAVPTAGELFVARRGGGAFLNGARLAVPAGLSIRNGLTAIGASHRAPAAELAAVVGRLLAAGGMFYRNGSGAAMLAYVAAGRLAAYYEPHMYPWDALAGMLLVEEAGGRVAPYRPAGGLATGAVALAAGHGAWDEMAAVVGAKAGL